MHHDYATILLKQHANVASERTAAHAMKVLDRHVLELFSSDMRDFAQQLLPGMTRRRLGNRFGLHRPVPKGDSIEYSAFLDKIRKDLGLTDQSEAEMYFDAYMQSHMSLMTNSARLEFASICEGDVLRAYLRAVDALV
ncbi:MAG: hypothetical protein QG658_118 [Patescibacteria group bacterium]|jgi:hypothetical protein|nr:hypothetical protein [Patescibacteria group bacterium]